MTRTASLALLVALALTGANPLHAQTAQTVPIRVLASNGVKAVLESLEADAAKAIGRPLDIEFSTASSLKAQIDGGRAFDVAVLTPGIIDALVADQKIVADSRKNFARVGVGLGMREDAAAPDISTDAKLKAALLAAKSLAFTGDGQSRITIDKAFATLDIVEPMRAKTILKGPGEAPEAVAAGEADVVLTLISEILPVPGLKLVGPLPASVQGYVSFTAGRSPAARDRAGADALLDYLGTPGVAAALEAHGMETY